METWYIVMTMDNTVGTFLYQTKEGLTEYVHICAHIAYMCLFTITKQKLTAPYGWVSYFTQQLAFRTKNNKKSL